MKLITILLSFIFILTSNAQRPNIIYIMADEQISVVGRKEMLLGVFKRVYAFENTFKSNRFITLTP